MDANQQLMMWLALERGCSCEICGVGIWLKKLQADKRLPDYLVLYHRDGQLYNKNIDNVALRCVYCSKHPDIKGESFKHPKKKMNPDHIQAGRVWYNNGIINKFVDPAEVHLFKKMGWERGRMVPPKDKLPPNHAGKIRITNGIINKFWDPVNPIPDGWWRGKLNYSKLEKYDYLSL
jgi:hypothetical protein